jgi:hypothetical protein
MFLLMTILTRQSCSRSISHKEEKEVFVRYLIVEVHALISDKNHLPPFVIFVPL